MDPIPLAHLAEKGMCRTNISVIFCLSVLVSAKSGDI